MPVSHDEIADGLVTLTEHPPYNVFAVTFGVGADRYKLMYDKRDVAEGITRSLRALVKAALREVTGVGRAVLQEGDPHTG